jgi:host factor-I protein
MLSNPNVLSKMQKVVCPPFCIYNGNMTPSVSTRRRSKTPPPGETGQEALYLRSLSDRQVNVQIKLRDGETVRGWIEYFDDGMLRLTREGKPNLFIYKHQIQTITEVSKRPPRHAKAAGAELNGTGLNGNGSNGASSNGAGE